MHTSLSLDKPIEIINLTPINPMIAKCQIKVLYVSDEPNRNGTIINKETAKKLANSLPGSPIVGYYNEATKDFELHNKFLKIEDGEIKLAENTRPYGFVDLNAKAWFQWFADDDGVDREYLVTEGYLWVGQYPECQRVIDQGNPQSMELDEKTLQVSWAKFEKGSKRFCIINDGLISKLCILGEDVEPCFEGANVTSYSLTMDEDFKTQIYSMINTIKEFLEEGGATQMVINENENVVTEEPINSTENLDNTDKTVVTENQENIGEEPTVEPTAAEPAVATSYNLDEIPEYVELMEKYNTLSTDYNALKATNDTLNNTIAELTAFKLNVEKQQKLAMIDSFYMLSDADKKDVIDNIDNYSVSDIEAKLSIICVRNKVNFNLSSDEGEMQPAAAANTYNLTSIETVEDVTPAWVQRALAVEKEMK